MIWMKRRASAGILNEWHRNAAFNRLTPGSLSKRRGHAKPIHTANFEGGQVTGREARLVYECTAQVVDRETNKVEREFKATHPIETEAERLAVDQATAFIKNLKP